MLQNYGFFFVLRFLRRIFRFVPDIAIMGDTLAADLAAGNAANNANAKVIAPLKNQ